MAHDKRKRAQPSKKRKQQKEVAQKVRRPDTSTEPSGPDQPGIRRRPGEGLDKSDEGVVAGGRLAGRRFTG